METYLENFRRLTNLEIPMLYPAPPPPAKKKKKKTSKSI